MSVRLTIECWCLCGGAMRAEVTSSDAVKTIHEVFRSLHEGPGHGVATKEQAAAARRKQDRRRPQ
jgi:hypothetical protein